MRILIIEDSPEIASNLAAFLEARGQVVDFATLGREGLNMLHKHPYDVIVLDLMLPDMDGVKLCRTLRSDPVYGHLPVLMLTARDTLDEKLVGFEAGADDYMVKPFSSLELEARLKALYQRRWVTGQSRVLVFEELVYDLDKITIYRGKRRIELPRAPRNILEVLMRAAGSTVSRSELTTMLWGDDPPDADALSVHMHTLRTALHAGGEAPILQTVRGAGYRLATKS